MRDERAKQWLKESKRLRILVTGKTGAGKSALVNGIVGKYVAKEGDTLDPETSKVAEYCTTINNVEVVIYDSPGLQDGTLNEDAYLKDMEEKCKKVDLVLYCTKMTEKRVDSGDVVAISKLSKAFGVNTFWKNTLIVLTFANEVKPPPKRGSAECLGGQQLSEYFKSRLQEWQMVLHQVLSRAGVEKDIAEKVPVVPAGYHLEPSLPNVDCDYWLSNLWFKCLDRTANNAKPALLKINWNRLKTSSEVTKESISSQKLYQQPIVYRGDVNIIVPMVILDFLDLPAELTEAGMVGRMVGSTIGSCVGSAIDSRVGGSIGMEIGGIGGAVLGELIYKYGKVLWEEWNKD